MSKVLYRKYRAKDFTELIGLDPIVRTVTKALEKETFPHAYLFSGSKGTGKTSIARIIAKALNCESPKNGNPCNKCKNCKAIDKGKFLDLVEIDAASNRGINEIRDLRDQTNFLPSEGKYKVFIIDEAHMLTNEAFNALLKTLEEPPDHVIFILATTEAHKIPATISSRCQQFSLNLAEKTHLESKLKYIAKKENVIISQDALDLIVSNAQGSYRDAESILDKIIGSGTKNVSVDTIDSVLGLVDSKIVKEWFKALTEKDISTALDILNRTTTDGKNISQLIKQTLEVCRQELISKFTKKEKSKFETKDLIRIIDILSNANMQIKSSPIQELPIEVAIIKICEGEKIKTYEEPRGSKLLHSNKTDKKDQVKENIANVTGAISSIPKKLKLKKENRSKTNKKIKREDIEEKWDKILNEVKPFNNHLTAFLKKSQIKEVNGNKLILEVPYQFHKQRIESNKSRKVIEDTSLKIFGLSLTPVCCINPAIATDISELDAEKEIKSNDKVILEVFGDLLE